MMIYEKLFNEYSQLTAQVLLTKESITNEECRKNARQTFDELFRMKVVPIVNENDAISVDELSYGNFGDNDTLAAYVAKLVDADLLILMSDIDGLYTDDPKKNPNARFIHTVVGIDEELEKMAKGASNDMGTGGMATKIGAAKIATASGADMVIANGRNIYTINDIMAGKKIGTLFLSREHGIELKNELAPERAQYRRQAKKQKKENQKEDETKSMYHMEQETMGVSMNLIGGSYGRGPWKHWVTGQKQHPGRQQRWERRKKTAGFCP